MDLKLECCYYVRVMGVNMSKKTIVKIPSFEEVSVARRTQAIDGTPSKCTGEGIN